MTRDFELTVKYDGFKRALARISETELPEAIAAGINRIAGGAASAQLQNVRHDFILRNKYTERSLAFYRANPKKDIGRINAIVGSKQPYLALQEEGGERRPVKGSRVPVPTKRSRGGNWRAPAQRRYSPKRGPLTGRFFILQPGTTGAKRHAAYRLTSPAMFRRDAGGLVKVRLLDQPSYHLKATHWHESAVMRYARLPLMQAAFIAEAKRRLAKYQAS